ncbi:RagB/SusD family nutrient uptake outer membrane protein [Segetibacter koreensis]|uniref:RagB/SusD family nutrient uptake outer membrane protein n=1 Tax=Segetibacter koreensis TaxID=398037 RepID=UPI00036E4311|nr:RagB/SusD family nutrient uptake outer membrane protein [Segetibacter koreensis]
MKFKIVILLYVLVSFSCNKKLDVQPQNTVPAEEIKTSDDVKAVLFGAYSTWQNANAFGEKYNTFTELLVNDNDIDWAGTFAEYRDINNKEEDKLAPGIYQVWANSYHTINAANIVLSKLDLLGADDKTVVEGEAKFFRGVTYYYLVNLFARPWSAGNVSSNPGVPLILAPLTGYDAAKDKLPRASVEAVYKQVLSDLTDAVSKLPETSGSFRATKFSAEAMLSRVYLSQEKYAEAAAAANDVIQSQNFSLTQLFSNAFNNVANSTEDIFAIQQTAQSNTGTANFGITTFYSSYPVGRGELQITDAHIAKYEAGDARGAFFYDGVSISGSPGHLTSKWKNLYKAIPVVRLAEMYLTRAEANFRKGGAPVGPNTPIEDVNIIRSRATLPPLAALASVDDIVAERYKELAFEGERFLTVKRLKIPVKEHSYDDPRLIFPIPQREIDLGNALPQNEGY